MTTAQDIGYESDGADDKIYDKVAKILAKAERAGTPEEAELFFGKAQEMITKHALDELALQQRVNGGSGKAETVSHELVAFKSIYFKAECRVWGAVARANSCRVLIQDKQWREQQGVILIGTPSDRTNVKMLMASLQIQIARATRTVPDYVGGKNMDKFVWRRSFREGFAGEIGRRLEGATKSAAQGHKSGDMLPVLASKAQQAKAYEDDTFQVSTPKASRARVDHLGRGAGMSAAQRADVGSPRVGGTKGALGR